jgi:hypothetical protein
MLDIHKKLQQRLEVNAKHKAHNTEKEYKEGVPSVRGVMRQFVPGVLRRIWDKGVRYPRHYFAEKRNFFHNNNWAS